MSIESAAPSFLSASRQLLLVVVDNWSSTTGNLQRFVRADGGLAWQPVGAAVALSLGKAGLAWGRGLHGAHAPGLEKCEGDGRAPAGVFAISALFGAAGVGSDLARAAKLPYLPATADLKAIDDPASRHYNRIVDQSALAERDWVSCEDMLRDDQRYAVGAVVGHNVGPVVAGAGSCIFLHVWAAAGVPTAGCTAMALADMRALAAWLDGAAAPVLVQLPRAEFERCQAAWGLPSLEG